MKFKISSALKDQIGKELITDDNVAIFELVKNSYDANATKVKIVFEDMRSDNPKIYIVDNGKGMSKEDLENKWLFIGFSEKRDLLKTKESRFLAGTKGIGRFSCDRLGSKLNIYTKARTDKNFNSLSINWNEFEKDQNKEFKEIDVDIKEKEIVNEDFGIIKFSGTIIEISDLREKDWTWEKLLKLKRYLQRLINPLQVSNKDTFNIELIAKDFIINDTEKEYDYDKVNGPIKNIVYETLGVKTTTIDCNISEDGNKIITNLDDKGINIFKLEEENKNFKLLRDIKVKVSYLNSIAKTTFKRIMGIQVVNYGNIFVFKNGFRVFPYGEIDNDWLNLNLRKTQGTRRFLGTRELLGRVEIMDSSNTFKETTSRSEGLVNNPAFLELKNFVLEVIIQKLERYIVGAIYWDSENRKKNIESIKKDTLKIIEQIAGNLDNKSLDYNQDFLEIVEEKTIDRIPNVINNLNDLIKKEKDPEIKDAYQQQINSLKLGISLLKKKQRGELQKKEQETQFLRSITSKEFEEVVSYLHDIGIYSDTIEKNMKRLKRGVLDNKLSQEEIINYLDNVLMENKKIMSISRYITKPDILINSEEESNDLISFIKNYILEVAPIFSEDLSIEVLNKSNQMFNMKFRPIQIMTILDNLIDNSKKHRAKNMTVKFDFQPKNMLIIHIIDDGTGLDKSVNENDIFNKGITTTRGSGLGLFHVKKIINELGGKIEVNNSLNKGIEFIINLKK